MFLVGTWQDELKGLQGLAKHGDPVPAENIINVVRGQEFQCFMRAFSRKSFNVHKRLDIQFMDEENVTEGTDDNGGPTSEFLQLLLQSKQQCFQRNSHL